MKKKLLLIFFTLFDFVSYSQSIIHTEDIDNFWVAYDSIKYVKDEKTKIEIFKKLYNDKGSFGLKAFMEEKHFSAESQVKKINQFPKFWTSLRPKTQNLGNAKEELDKTIAKFREFYPQLKPSQIYFCIGGFNSGGTTQKDKVLVGAEIALLITDKTIDCSEFSSNMAGIFNETNIENAIVGIEIHEYVHTQQNLDNEKKFLLLGNAISEGSADFITNLLAPYHLPIYVSYYKKHEFDIWNQFKQDMRNRSRSQWIASSGNPNIPFADLGYSVGFTICEHYYKNAKDKKQAIKDIINLNYDDEKATLIFLKKSGYETYLKSKGFVLKKRHKEGYIEDKNTVTFIFDLKNKITNQDFKVFSDEEKKYFKSVQVAGDFNKWDTKSKQYELKKINDSEYKLKIAKSKLGKKGEIKYFKFVVDGENWVEPQFNSTNKGSANNADTNLFIKL